MKLALLTPPWSGRIDFNPRQSGSPQCECPSAALVRLEPGARLELGPFATAWPRASGVAIPGCPEALEPGAYRLEVDAMSALDSYCSPDCDCVPGVSGACLTTALAGEGEVLTQIQDVVLPACEATFTFREP